MSRRILCFLAFSVRRKWNPFLAQTGEEEELSWEACSVLNLLSLRCLVRCLGGSGMLT